MSKRANLIGTAIVTGGRKRRGEILLAVTTLGVTTDLADTGAAIQLAWGTRRFTMVTVQEAASAARLTITTLGTAILRSGDGEIAEDFWCTGKVLSGFSPVP